MKKVHISVCVGLCIDLSIDAEGEPFWQQPQVSLYITRLNFCLTYPVHLSFYQLPCTKQFNRDMMCASDKPTFRLLESHQCYKKPVINCQWKLMCGMLRCMRNTGRMRMAALASQKELSQRDHADFLSTVLAKWCRDKV